MATSGPIAPVQPPTLWAMLAWVRREIGHIAVRAAPAATPAAGLQAVELSQSLSAPAVSPLGTPEQLEAEKIAARTVNTLPVKLMKLVLRHSFLHTARQQFPDGPDAENLAALNNAVDEYAMAAAFQQQLLNPMAPTVITQVAPPHTWYGMDVGGSRILYDNPDTIYRFMSVNASSSYVITGRFDDYPNGVPADVSFSVLEGLSGTTSSILTADDLEIGPDGTFRITVSGRPAAPGEDHLQLTSSPTISPELAMPTGADIGGTKWRSQSVDAVRAIGLFLRLMKNVPDPELRQTYRGRMTTMLLRRPDPNLWFICVLKCAMHYHHYTMSRQMVEQRTLVKTF